MAARTLSADPAAWERVARAVHARRLELGLTATQTVDRSGGGLSTAVLSLIENARRESYAVRSLVALCRALDWSPDSIERIISGEGPVVVDNVAPSQTIEDKIAAIEEELTAIKRLLIERART